MQIYMACNGCSPDPHKPLPEHIIMRRIPNLETERLIIRPFVMEDFEPLMRMTQQGFGEGAAMDDPSNIEDMEISRRMHEWRVLNEEMLARLYQAPYGDRAVVLKTTNELIGSVGLVPYLDAFNSIPALRYFHGDSNDGGNRPRATAEAGLFWLIDAAHRGKGYAGEAAQALINYAFNDMHLIRIIATTDFDNHASQRVMQKLGMTLHHNEAGQPPWLQVVGVLEQFPSTMQI
jgi:RimJ/RimL family protein N-acetyltransferase